MKTYPLVSMSFEDAKDMQFRIVDEITSEFQGLESLSRGDLGVRQPDNKPWTTKKVERVIKEVFHAEDAALVRGSGTNAIRQALAVCLQSNKKILVHDAPIYPTTKDTLNLLGADIITADYNDLSMLEETLTKNKDIACALIQITRQTLEDSYDAKQVIRTIKGCNKKIYIVTDDNYAVFKTPDIGCQLGADLSTFSTFKILGPEGVGCLVGRKDLISKVQQMNYSGGSQVQGHEAMDVLRGFVYAPVSLAIQADVLEGVQEYLKEGHIKEIEDSYIANAQSKVLIVKLKKNNALDVLREAEKLGALPHPVGAESKYELAPLFYRASATFRAQDKDAIHHLIRINPNRAGASTIIEILKKAIKNA